MNNDALGLDFQIVEIRFCCKANAFQNEIAHRVYGASRYNVRNQIQTHLLIASAFTCSLLLLFVFACCVAFAIKLLIIQWFCFSMFHFVFVFSKRCCATKLFYRGDERTG